MMSEDQNFVADVLKKLKSRGADQADAFLVQEQEYSVRTRLEQLEKFEQSDKKTLSLRAIVGQRQALASSTDLSTAAIDQLVDQVVTMAKASPEDPFTGLADASVMARFVINPDGFDPREPQAEELQQWAKRAEKAALSVQGVTNSEGAEASWGASQTTLANTHDSNLTILRTAYQISVSALAGEGQNMERDDDYSRTVYAEDLENPDDIGVRAGQKAVLRLNPRKLKTTRAPVIFSPRVGQELLRYFADAVNGAAIAKGTSFLKDSLGKKIFSDGITILDDPTRLRGLRSRPFDADGLFCNPLILAENGVLKNWFLDTKTARQLGMTSTGHAWRSVNSLPTPSPTNLFMMPGSITSEDMLKSVKEGLYVTDVMGFGVNPVTGDYSQGASGIWIEDGHFAYPVAEITIAGNLKDMFLNMSVADDLLFHYGMNTPTLLIEEMMIAGA